MAVMSVETDPARMKEDAEKLREDTGSMRIKLAEMMQDLEELHSMWKGKAKEAFCTQVDEDRCRMEELLKKMDYLAACISSASREYTWCEQEVESMADSIRF